MYFFTCIFRNVCCLVAPIPGLLAHWVNLKFSCGLLCSTHYFIGSTKAFQKECCVLNLCTDSNIHTIFSATLTNDDVCFWVCSCAKSFSMRQYYEHCFFFLFLFLCWLWQNKAFHTIIYATFRTANTLLSSTFFKKFNHNDWYMVDCVDPLIINWVLFVLMNHTLWQKCMLKNVNV